MARISLLLLLCCLVQAHAEALKLNLRRLEKAEGSTNLWKQIETPASWEPRGTAAVVCDMWDQHWCKGATARVGEMAPRMNRLLAELRKRGVLIIHCPSGTMKFYENAPGRKLAQSAEKAVPAVPLQGWCNLDRKKEAELPIDDSDGGCDDEPRCSTASPWTREVVSIEIKEEDAITDSAEAYNLMRTRGITNVIVMGVHQNMCVLGRPFSIRQMVYQGQNVVLVRDMTDSMYNSRAKPFVNHFEGNDLVTWHIEKYWCPTMTSDQILGDKPFHFSADKQWPRAWRN